MVETEGEKDEILDGSLDVCIRQPECLGRCLRQNKTVPSNLGQNRKLRWRECGTVDPD